MTAWKFSTSATFFSAVALLLAAHSCTAILPAQQPEQTPELKRPSEPITERSIAATLSFLASDELAGRDTPSKELNIASAYVASRFRAAGLQGGGDRDGFYQTTQVATVRMPTCGIQVFENERPVKNFGLMGGTDHTWSYEGSLTPVSHNENIRARRFDGPVYFEPGEITGPRSIAYLIRQTTLLKQNGATAILIPASPDSILVGLAGRKLQPSIVQPIGDFPGPTLLVPKLDPARNFKISIPPMSGGRAKVHNVIGVLPGRDPQFKHEAILFTAHLDHIGQTVGAGDTIYNGADDDASGVAAVLALADAYTSLPQPPKRTVIFMAFWGEEKGLLGSRHFAKHPTWRLENIVAHLNIEMIGRPEPGAHEKVWMTGWSHSNLGELMNQGSSRIGVEIFEHPKLSPMLYRASDNFPLAERGVIAHSFSAGSLHEDYHQVTDEWEKLNLPHMTRVIQGLFAGSLPLANGELTPQKTSR